MNSHIIDNYQSTMPDGGQFFGQIRDLQKKVHLNAKHKGFYDKLPMNTGEQLMLVTSELGEALEADRNRRFADWNGFDEVVFDPQFKGWGSGFLNDHFENFIKDTFEDELADVVIRIMDMAEFRGIDLELHIWAKMAYNAGRERLHGKAY